jgi:two-component system, NarL family, response regulator DevR
MVLTDNMNRADQIRVIVVDRHPMILKGVGAALKHAPDISICASATSADQAVESGQEIQPDVAIIDLRLLDDSGIKAIGKIRARWPQVKILVITIFDDKALLRKSIAAGASGYMIIDASEVAGNKELNATLVRAVRAVAAGHICLDPVMTGYVVDWVRNTPEWIIETSTDARLGRLSPQEKQTLLLMCEGMRNIGIAEEMSLSHRTVEGYVFSVLRKLEVSNRAEAIAYIRRLRQPS